MRSYVRSMSVLVRSAFGDDAEALSRLHEECFPDAWSAETIRSLIERSSVVGLVNAAEDEREVRAFLLMQVIAEEAEILTFCVANRFRRMGIGGSLLAAATMRASALGAVSVVLEVGVDNGSALSLYVSQGFKQIGVRPAYYRGKTGYGPAMDALVLKKILEGRTLSPGSELG